MIISFEFSSLVFLLLPFLALSFFFILKPKIHIKQLELYHEKYKKIEKELEDILIETQDSILNLEKEFILSIKNSENSVEKIQFLEDNLNNLIKKRLADISTYFKKIKTDIREQKELMDDILKNKNLKYDENLFSRWERLSNKLGNIYERNLNNYKEKYTDLEFGEIGSNNEFNLNLSFLNLYDNNKCINDVRTITVEANNFINFGREVLETLKELDEEMIRIYTTIP
jgi:hypothetical protein